MGYKNVSAPP